MSREIFAASAVCLRVAEGVSRLPLRLGREKCVRRPHGRWLLRGVRSVVIGALPGLLLTVRDAGSLISRESATEAWCYATGCWWSTLSQGGRTAGPSTRADKDGATGIAVPYEEAEHGVEGPMENSRLTTGRSHVMLTVCDVVGLLRGLLTRGVARRSRLLSLPAGRDRGRPCGGWCFSVAHK